MMLDNLNRSKVGQKWGVEILAQCKDFKSNKLQVVLFSHLLINRTRKYLHKTKEHLLDSKDYSVIGTTDTIE